MQRKQEVAYTQNTHSMKPDNKLIIDEQAKYLRCTDYAKTSTQKAFKPILKPVHPSYKYIKLL